jgi:CubicO group peptidase (beta-lactamase class C family)
VLFSTAVAVPPEPDIRARVSSTFGPLVGEGPNLAVGIAVGVVTPTGRSHYEFGKTNSDNGKPLSENTLFELGSVSKIFTTTLLADAVVRGRVKLSDAYQNCPRHSTSALCYQGHAIRLVHLATHTSGLPFMPDNVNYLSVNPLGDYGQANVKEFFAKFKLHRLPGEKFEYSNLGMGLLGAYVAEKEKVSYQKLLQSRLSGPLGMTDTVTVLNDEQRLRRANGFAIQKATGRQGGVPSHELGDGSIFPGAGGIDSTTHDMMQWIAANLGLVPSPLQAVFDLAQKSQREMGPGHKIGLGWNLEGDAVFHFGYTQGYRAFVGFIREKKVGLVVLTNTVVEDGRLDEACWTTLGYLGS